MEGHLKGLSASLFSRYSRRPEQRTPYPGGMHQTTVLLRIRAQLAVDRLGVGSSRHGWALEAHQVTDLDPDAMIPRFNM